MESDEESQLAAAEVGTSWKTKTNTTATRKAKEPPSYETKEKKRPRNQGIWEAAFQKAEKDNFLGIIIIRGEPYVQLRQLQVEEINKTLMSELHTAIKTALVPRFDNSGRQNGRLCLSCADQTTFDWLRSTVEDLTANVNEDGRKSCQRQLVLITPSEIPKLIWAEVYVSGTPPSVSEFTTFLERQNVGLFTDRWVLCHRQTTPKGMLMVWHIDPDSVRALEAIDFQPYFGLGRVTFRVARAQHQSKADVYIT